MPLWKTEVERSRRFEFGKNWAKFLAEVDEERIREAEDSLKRALGLESLCGKTFLDVGSGSGLFSLAARRLGAQVRSFDYDPLSVQCTARLKELYRSGDSLWTVESGNVLDQAYLQSLGSFDVVYAWGVLHHTGDLRQALGNVAGLVADGGLLYLAIYNRQEFLSPLWTVVKRAYNRAPGGIRSLMNVSYFLLLASAFFVLDLARGRNPLARHRGHRRRGMSVYRDVADWLGGYPFETARPEEIFRTYRDLGFVLVELVTVGSKSGCNEFVFRKPGPRPS